MWYTLDCLAAARTGFIHSDHLGSTSLTTNITGTVVAETRYLPYAEERWTSGGAVTDFTFTGQRAERGFGLMDYNARYYDPGLGRFVSADTVVPQAGNPQALNRYAYVLGNPLRYNDPTGHYLFEEEPDDSFIWRQDKPANTLIRTAEPVAFSQADRNRDGNRSPGLASPPFQGPPDEPPSGESLDFVGFWEMDRLDAAGVRLNLSAWIPNFPIVGGDISLDAVYNVHTDELSVFLTPGILVGIGEGADVSIGGIGLYDLEDNSDYAGWGGGGQAAIIPAIGGQAAWAFSFSRGASGKQAQMWHGGIGGGAEFSASGTLGYGVEVVQWNKEGIWLLPETRFERKLY
jgi:RHS repeat-associated protein